MTEYSALPWKLFGAVDIVDSNGKAIACVYISDEQQANARFIVTACNSHAELLEVAKSVAVLGKCHCHAMKAGFTCYICRAKQAIRKAEEQA